jgi:hypothetical protein
LTKTTLAVAASRDSLEHQPKVMEFQWPAGISGFILADRIDPGACDAGLECGGEN